MSKKKTKTLDTTSLNSLYKEWSFLYTMYYKLNSVRNIDFKIRPSNQKQIFTHPGPMGRKSLNFAHVFVCNWICVFGLSDTFSKQSKFSLTQIKYELLIFYLCLIQSFFHKNLRVLIVSCKLSSSQLELANTFILGNNLI